MILQTAPGAGTGTITVSAPVTWTMASTLTLIADSDINILSEITNTSAGAGAAIALQSIGGNINIDALAGGGLVGLGTVNGPISVSAPLGNINIIGGSVVNAAAYVGALGAAPFGTTTGDIFVECGRNLNITGGSFTGGGHPEEHPLPMHQLAGLDIFPEAQQDPLLLLTQQLLMSVMIAI